MRVSIASPLMQPSPNGRRVGIRIVTFEACSSFTHVTAHRIAQSPKATFVTRLQPCRLPSRAARQLPDQSTILRVEFSSTDDSRLRGARPTSDIVGATIANRRRQKFSRSLRSGLFSVSMIFFHCGGKRALHATKRTASPKLTLPLDHLVRAGQCRGSRSHSRWLRTARRTSGK